MQVITSYHDIAFEHKQREKAVESVIREMDWYPDSVGIVCTGLSGILVALPVADRTKRPFAIVRKPDERSHGLYPVEGYRLQRYVIIDDFMISGDTVNRILKIMEEHTPGVVCHGILLYSYHGQIAPLEYKGQQISVITCT